MTTLNRFQAETKARHERKAGKRLKLTTRQIVASVDAVFFASPDKPGWVEMYANAHGRKCIDTLFPNAHITWTAEPAIGDDWRGFEINLPDTCNETEHKIATDIMPPGMVIADSSQAGLAWLLAVSAERQGARTASYNGRDEYTLYSPPTN